MSARLVRVFHYRKASQYRCSNLKKDASKSQRLSTYLCRLRRQRGLLQQLEVVIDARIQLAEIEIAEHEATKSPCTINHLSDETLTLIFSFCATGYGEYGLREQKMLPFISRRFRKLALRMPSMWTYVDLAMPLSRLNVQIERSKTEDLYVSIYNPLFNGQAEVMRCLKRVLEESHRWSTLILDAHPHVISELNRFFFFPRLRIITNLLA